MKHFRSNKGFTLLELIVVLSIIGLVITTIFSILFFGYDVFGRTQKEFDIQSQVRLAMEEMGGLIRGSRALFAVPSIDYKDPEWRYIALNDSHDRIVSYSFNTGTSSWEEATLIGPYEGVTFKIGFDKHNNMSRDNFLRMYIEAYTGDGSFKRFDIQSGYEALNALQVVDYGTVANPAIALAYRNDEFAYENFQLIVNIALVLDYSDSMNKTISGNNPDNNNLSRITTLREKVANLVRQFSENKNDNVNINMSVIPFKSSANSPSAFYNIKDTSQRNSLLGIVNSTNASGMTNTGDGLRRAYHQLYNKSSNDINTSSGDTKIMNYTIVLVDGDSNTYTGNFTRSCVWFGLICSREFQSFYFGDGDVSSIPGGSTAGTWHTNTSDTTLSRQYVTNMGAYLTDPDFVTNYLISFAKGPTTNGITNVKNALSVPDSKYFDAQSSEALELSFTEIQMQITNDLWHFLGPKLVE